MTTVLLVFLFAAFALFPLLMLEKILPYPYILEEILKAIFVLILLGIDKRKDNRIFLCVLVAGGIFAFSESVIYLLNILSIQNPILFFHRLLAAGAMHVFTIAVIYWFGRRGNFWLIVGLLLAMVIHYLYNSWLVLHLI